MVARAAIAAPALAPLAPLRHSLRSRLRDDSRPTQANPVVSSNP